MSMIIPPAVVEAIPARVRQGVYVGLILGAVILAAWHAAYDALARPDPHALVVAFAVLKVLTTAGLALATANARTAVRTAPTARPKSARPAEAPAASTDPPPAPRRTRRRPAVRTPEDDDQTSMS